MERYQLSQDFQEKQLQLLQRKYGGASQATDAAFTIQRAFRRYSMAKKFADLTAQAKTEKRASRRLDFAAGDNSSLPSTPKSGSSSGSAATVPPKRSSLATENSSNSFHHHHYHNHHHPHHHHHRRPLYQANDAHNCPVVSDWRHQANNSTAISDPNSRSKLCEIHQAQQQQQQQQEVLNTNSIDGVEGSNSCADIQSFPLDETSVYGFPSNSSVRHHHHQQQQQHHHHHNHQQQFHGQQQPQSPPGHFHQQQQKQQQHHRLSPLNHSDIDRNSNRYEKENSYRYTSQNGIVAPNVPKRTVSRLSSTDLPATSKPHKSQLIHNQSSPQIIPTTTNTKLGSGLHHSRSITNTADVVDSNGPSHNVRVIHRQNNIAHRLHNSDNNSGYTVNEIIRKRHYRTGLNIFNKKPEKGIAYLIKKGFLENSPESVAKFLIVRKGLAKQMIGEYLGIMSNSFNKSVLNCFTMEMDFSGMQIDVAVRKFQTYFRLPGEAQKIQFIVEVFSDRYCQCNPEFVSQFNKTSETVFLVAFATILLNTDLHTPNLKPDKRMKVDDFVRNLREIDEGEDVDYNMLCGIYERIRKDALKTGSDHVTQVAKVQSSITGKCPTLAVPHRRLVCYCRLYEVTDPNKKERPGIHQREVFLFNDLLVMTKIHSRKKDGVNYSFRHDYTLAGMMVNLFETPFYPFGIRISQKWDRKTVLILNARNEHDRTKFVEDLKESIAEMDELEALRIESELERQRLSLLDNRDSNDINNPNVNSNNTDKRLIVTNHPNSPVVGAASGSSGSQANSNGVVLRRSAINNSLLDLSEASNEKMTRRGSVGSLDSGMSISFQSNSVGSFYIGNNGIIQPHSTSITVDANNVPATRNHHHHPPVMKSDLYNKNDHVVVGSTSAHHK